MNQIIMWLLNGSFGNEMKTLSFHSGYFLFNLNQKTNGHWTQPLTSSIHSHKCCDFRIFWFVHFITIIHERKRTMERDMIKGRGEKIEWFFFHLIDYFEHPIHPDFWPKKKEKQKINRIYPRGKKSVVYVERV